MGFLDSVTSIVGAMIGVVVATAFVDAIMAVVVGAMIAVVVTVITGDNEPVMLETHDEDMHEQANDAAEAIKRDALNHEKVCCYEQWIDSCLVEGKEEGFFFLNEDGLKSTPSLSFEMIKTKCRDSDHEAKAFRIVETWRDDMVDRGFCQDCYNGSKKKCICEQAHKYVHGQIEKKLMDLNHPNGLPQWWVWPTKEEGMDEALVRLGYHY